jgi:glutamine amidotransferase
MKMLIDSGLDNSTLKQPVLGICLGMQLMCKIRRGILLVWKF